MHIATSFEINKVYTVVSYAKGSYDVVCGFQSLLVPTCVNANSNRWRSHLPRWIARSATAVPMDLWFRIAGLCSSIPWLHDTVFKKYRAWMDRGGSWLDPPTILHCWVIEILSLVTHQHHIKVEDNIVWCRIAVAKNWSASQILS